MAQIRQNARQIPANRATHAAVVHGNDLLLVRAHNEIVVDVFRPEFVLDHRDFVLMVFRQNAVEQRRLPSTEKACENGHRNVRFLRFFYYHLSPLSIRL